MILPLIIAGMIGFGSQDLTEPIDLNNLKPIIKQEETKLDSMVRVMSEDLRKGDQALNQGDEEKAIQFYQSGLETMNELEYRAPTLATLESEVRGNLGLAYQRSGMLNEMLTQYVFAFELDENHESMNNLAYGLFLTGIELQTAEKLADAAVQRQPGNPNYWGTLGAVYWRQEKFEQAISTINHARKLSGEQDPNAKAHLRILHNCYRALGDTTNAEQYQLQLQEMDK
jgi:Flp pilus assembly protein TadD